MYNIVVSIIILAMTSVCASAHEPLRSFEGVVSHIIDGDTLGVTDLRGADVQVRLYAIAAPEVAKRSSKTGNIAKPGQPFGEESLRALQGKLHLQKVRIDVMDIDNKGKAVSTVWLGTRNINREMVAEGWAWAYRHDSKKPHDPEYMQLEDQARAQRLGLWQQNNPQPPWEYRNSLRLKRWLISPFL